MKKHLRAILIFGALWGLTEATLGYLLHQLPISIGYVVWFPLAFLFIRCMQRATHSRSAVLCAAFIAAAVKFVDILLPGSIDRVVNPAMSIVLETLSVVSLCWWTEQPPLRREVTAVFAASALWRAMYAAYVTLLPNWMLRISPVATPASAVQFLLWESVLSGAIILAVVTATRLIRARLQQRSGSAIPVMLSVPNPLKKAAPYGLLAAALVAQRVLQ